MRRGKEIAKERRRLQRKQTASENLLAEAVLDFEQATLTPTSSVTTTAGEASPAASSSSTRRGGEEQNSVASFGRAPCAEKGCCPRDRVAVEHAAANLREAYAGSTGGATAGKLDDGVRCVAHLQSAAWTACALAVRNSLHDDTLEDPEKTWGPKYIRNCIHSCITYQQKDGTGGLEGATMRFSPESSEAHNRGLPAVHRRLDEKVRRYFPWVSFADLFALAAVVAIESAGGPVIPLSVGRRDSDGAHLENTTIEKKPAEPGRLPYAEYGEYVDEEKELVLIASQMRKKLIQTVGLSDQMLVCLICGGHAFGRCHMEVSGYHGPWQKTPGVFNNSMAKNLLGESWRLVTKKDGGEAESRCSHYGRDESEASTQASDNGAPAPRRTYRCPHAAGESAEGPVEDAIGTAAEAEATSGSGTNGCPFTKLLNPELVPHGIRRQYVNEDENMMMLMSDMCLLKNDEWRHWLAIYAADEDRFREDFAIFFKQATELGWKDQSRRDDGKPVIRLPLLFATAIDIYVQIEAKGKVTVCVYKTQIAKDNDPRMWGAGTMDADALADLRKTRPGVPLYAPGFIVFYVWIIALVVCHVFYRRWHVRLRRTTSGHRSVMSREEIDVGDRPGSVRMEVLIQSGYSTSARATAMYAAWIGVIFYCVLIVILSWIGSPRFAPNTMLWLFNQYFMLNVCVAHPEKICDPMPVADFTNLKLFFFIWFVLALGGVLALATKWHEIGNFFRRPVALEEADFVVVTEYLVDSDPAAALFEHEATDRVAGSGEGGSRFSTSAAELLTQSKKSYYDSEVFSSKLAMKKDGAIVGSGDAGGAAGPRPTHDTLDAGSFEDFEREQLLRARESEDGGRGARPPPGRTTAMLTRLRDGDEILKATVRAKCDVSFDENNGFRPRSIEYEAMPLVFDGEAFRAPQSELASLTLAKLRNKTPRKLTVAQAREQRWTDPRDGCTRNELKITVPSYWWLVCCEVVLGVNIWQLARTVEAGVVGSPALVLVPLALTILQILYISWCKLVSARELKGAATVPHVRVCVWRSIDLGNGEVELCSHEDDSVNLQVGDLFELPVGATVPCDCLLVKGYALLDEADLTGEPLPIAKVAVEAREDLTLDFKKHGKRHILYGGTTVLQSEGPIPPPGVTTAEDQGEYEVEGPLAPRFGGAVPRFGDNDRSGSARVVLAPSSASMTRTGSSVVFARTGSARPYPRSAAEIEADDEKAEATASFGALNDSTGVKFGTNSDTALGSAGSAQYVRESNSSQGAVPVGGTRVLPTMDRKSAASVDKATKTQQRTFLSPTGGAVALVLATGGGTHKGGMTRKIMFPSTVKYKFHDNITLLFVVWVASLMFISLFPAIGKLGSPLAYREIIDALLESFLIAFVVLNPVILVGLMLAQTNAAARLEKGSQSGTRTLELNRLLMAGELSVQCLDKTGTITEEGLRLNVVQGSRGGTAAGEMAPEQRSMQFFGGSDSRRSLSALLDVSSARQRYFELALCTCHTAQRDENDALFGNAVEVEMLKFSLGERISFRAEENNVVEYFEPASGDPLFRVLKQFEFDASVQLQSAVVEDSQNSADDSLVVFCKGSYEAVSRRCRANTIPENAEKLSKQKALDGYYVIAVAMRRYRLGGGATVDKIRREELEEELEFLGFLYFRNEIKHDSPAALAELRHGGIKLVMITGDNLWTGVQVGRRSGLLPENAVVLAADLVGQAPPAPKKKGSRRGSALDDGGADKEKEERSLDRSGSLRDAVGPTQELHWHYLEEQHSKHFEEFRSIVEPSARTQYPSFIGWLAADASAHDPIGAGAAVALPSPTRTVAGARASSSSASEAGSNSGEHSVVLAVSEAAMLFLKQHDPGLLEELHHRIRVFGRMTPTGKVSVVRRMQAGGQVVGMCGDGGNDSAALRAAHAGLALSGGAKSMVGSFVSPSGSLFGLCDMVREGRCCLTVSVTVVKGTLLMGVCALAHRTIVNTGAGTLGVYDQLIAEVFLGNVVAVLLATAMQPRLLGHALLRTKPKVNADGRRDEADAERLAKERAKLYRDASAGNHAAESRSPRFSASEQSRRASHDTVDNSRQIPSAHEEEAHTEAPTAGGFFLAPTRPSGNILAGPKLQVLLVGSVLILLYSLCVARLRFWIVQNEWNVDYVGDTNAFVIRFERESEAARHTMPASELAFLIYVVGPLLVATALNVDFGRYRQWIWTHNWLWYLWFAIVVLLGVVFCVHNTKYNAWLMKNLDNKTSWIESDKMPAALLKALHLTDDDVRSSYHWFTRAESDERANHLANLGSTVADAKVRIFEEVAPQGPVDPAKENSFLEQFLANEQHAVGEKAKVVDWEAEEHSEATEEGEFLPELWDEETPRSSSHLVTGFQQQPSKPNQGVDPADPGAASACPHQENTGRGREQDYLGAACAYVDGRMKVRARNITMDILAQAGISSAGKATRRELHYVMHVHKGMAGSVALEFPDVLQDLAGEEGSSWLRQLPPERQEDLRSYACQELCEGSWEEGVERWRNAESFNRFYCWYAAIGASSGEQGDAKTCLLVPRTAGRRPLGPEFPTFIEDVLKWKGQFGNTREHSYGKDAKNATFDPLILIPQPTAEVPQEEPSKSSCVQLKAGAAAQGHQPPDAGARAVPEKEPPVQEQQADAQAPEPRPNQRGPFKVFYTNRHNVIEWHSLAADYKYRGGGKGNSSRTATNGGMVSKVRNSDEPLYLDADKGSWTVHTADYLPRRELSREDIAWFPKVYSKYPSTWRGAPNYSCYVLGLSVGFLLLMFGLLGIQYCLEARQAAKTGP
eukprot:g2460.t1